ncbi:protein FAR1-RELATED SEQUENCE 5-like [Apium graveolens]|uniref:protein FAR1-RELATED SEQUENCE 5-like n=1 Tax=Apium graveolens TaxID=4045 RepID=UPI003D78E72A
MFDSGDAGSGMALLRQLKEKSFGNFFYRVDLDEKNRVRGLVWVDHRSLNAYTNFGDVVSFDFTYRTNRYCMPFIPITGVNHHYQNILFGFALMRDETEISYKWVLKTWLEAVGNKPPLTIITDQDIALGNAIAEILPDTKHILCSWHISNKFPEKLSALYTQYPEFKGDFNDCLYKSLSPTEFVGKWEVLVDKYGLEDHVWLNDMYAIKDKWIRAYTKQHFSAGMTTTSRSESMNSFFDEYVKASTGLKEFIENSQNALETQILNEVKADYETEYKERRLIFNSALENHASSIYTKEMFRQFQNELRKSTSYVVNSCKDGSNYMWKLYLVEKYNVSENLRRRYRVMVSLEGNIDCECKKFEHSGMLCKHILRYLDKKQKTMIPTIFIKSRWTASANKIDGFSPYNPPVLVDVGDSTTARYSALFKSFQGLGALGSCSKPRYNYVMDLIEKGKCYVIEKFCEEENNSRMEEEFQVYDEHDPIFNPPMSQTKGRKKDSTRYKSGIETSTTKKNSGRSKSGIETSTEKIRYCGFCGVVGHDRRRCLKNPNRNFK